MTLKLGFVTTVEVDTEAKRVYVKAKTDPGTESDLVPFTMPASGMWYVPKQGDLVELYEVDDNTRAARVPHVPPTEFLMPTLAEGDFCFKFDDGTEIRVQKDTSDGDTYDVVIKGSSQVDVEAPRINITSSKFDTNIISDDDIFLTATGKIDVDSSDRILIDTTGYVDLHADGNVQIDAVGDIVLGDPAVAAALPTGDHTHSFSVSGTDSNGDSFSDSGTTGPPSSTTSTLKAE
jgi:phage baseplate assembly protein gpV